MALRGRGNAFFSNFFALFEILGCKKVTKMKILGYFLVSYGASRRAYAFFSNFFALFENLGCTKVTKMKILGYFLVS